MEILREQYEKEVVPALMKKFGYKSIMEVPKLEKIVLNIIALGITTLNFIIVLMLSAKTLKIELQKKFHI